MMVRVPGEGNVTSQTVENNCESKKQWVKVYNGGICIEKYFGEVEFFSSNVIRVLRDGIPIADIYNATVIIGENV